jgi:DnaJ like chaperone protein
MSGFLGKVVGAALGYALTRHIYGVVAGAALGHVWDLGLLSRTRAVPEGALVAPLFGLAGAVAKANGQVSPAEIAVTEELMRRMGLAGDARGRAITEFNRGKQAEFDVTAAARELRRFCGFRGELKLMLVEVLSEIGLADGRLDAGVHRILREVAQTLDLAPDVLDAILQRRGGARGGERTHRAGDARARADETKRPDPYVVLGVARAASDREVRKAYQRLMAQYHPDKLTAQGADAKTVQQAEERAREINAAYEQLRVLRGMK